LFCYFDGIAPGSCRQDIFGTVEAATATDATAAATASATEAAAAASPTKSAEATSPASATNPTDATAAPTKATDAQRMNADAGRVASRKQVAEVKKTLKLSTKMPNGVCEKQTAADKTANLKSIADASGKAALVDLKNSDGVCEAGRRRAAESKDNFAVVFAFADSVTPADVKAAIAEVNVKINAGAFNVSLAVNGTAVAITFTEVATQGEKTVTEWVVTYSSNNSTNATTAAPPATPKAGAALAGSSALATLALAAALFA